MCNASPTVYLTTKSLALGITVLVSTCVLANEPPVLSVQDKVVDVGEKLQFVVVPVDADGVVPDLFMKSAPSTAQLKDNGDGTRTFSWQPDSPGKYLVDFVVQDVQDDNLKNTYRSTITVVGHESVEAVTPSSDDKAESRKISIGQAVGDVSKILWEIPVSESQLSVQQTPLDTHDGYVYTANIEHGPNGGDARGFDLHTVLRQGYQRDDQTWDWKSVVVDDRTLFNKWHTAPSVGVDKTGRIHVAYNMHNFPWQYKASEHAHDIYSLQFKGQALSDAEIKRAFEENKTTFPTLGSAEIPGNQITYPAFYKDRNQDLYASYRFAAAPKQKFASRMMSSGVAVYNVTSRTWSPIGGDVNHADGDFDYDDNSPSKSVALAGERGWTSYLPKLRFERNNNMVANFFWREGIAGQQLKMPCVVRTSNRIDTTDLNGKLVQMPVSPNICGNTGVNNDRQFYNIGSFVLNRYDTPYLLMSPTDGSRFITYYIASEQRWVQEIAPESATEIFFDNDNNLYAIASGIKIFKRLAGQANWTKIYDEGHKRNCYPKVTKDNDGVNAFIHTQSCDAKTVTVYGLRLR